MSGENLPLVGKLLGHRRHQTRAGYVHLADEHLVEAAEKVGKIILENMKKSSPMEIFQLTLAKQNVKKRKRFETCRLADKQLQKHVFSQNFIATNVRHLGVQVAAYLDSRSSPEDHIATRAILYHSL